jgi:hypothetical protein
MNRKEREAYQKKKRKVRFPFHRPVPIDIPSAFPPPAPDPLSKVLGALTDNERLNIVGVLLEIVSRIAKGNS